MIVESEVVYPSKSDEKLDPACMECLPISAYSRVFPWEKTFEVEMFSSKTSVCPKCGRRAVTTNKRPDGSVFMFCGCCCWSLETDQFGRERSSERLGEIILDDSVLLSYIAPVLK